jgi:hypothetical protein
MKHALVFTISVSLALLYPQAALAQEREEPETEAFLLDSEAQPGVQTNAFSYDETSNTSSGIPIDNAQGGTTPVAGGGTPAPVIVGLSAHNCTPYTSSAGLDLGLNLGASGAGDCLTFSVPEPVQQVADRGRPRNRPGRAPDLEALVRTAVDRAIALAGKPELRVAPDGVGLTGLPSYFWLARTPQPISASASAGGLTVTAEAFPVQYVWRFGDGGDLITFGSGRPWTRNLPGDIEHTYETRDRYDLSVQVLYQARWQLNGGEWQALGFFSTSDARTYPVRQVVAVLVRPD